MEHRQWAHRLWTLVLLAGLGACGGGSSGSSDSGTDSGDGSEAPASTAPVADAGQDASLGEGVPVELDGSGSTDADADIASWSWTQLSGPSVALSANNEAVTRFTTPSLDATTSLVFELTVADGGGRTDKDTVEVRVVADPEANASHDYEVMAGTLVTLDGSMSGGEIEYIQWRQVENGSTAVEILNADNLEASFAAPAVTEATRLEFEIVLENSIGTTATDSVAFLVSPALPDWETFQGNAAHTGHVPTTVHSREFPLLWQWRTPRAASVTIGATVASNGSVYVGEDGYFEEQALFALDENTGEVNWEYSFGSVPALNPPAVSNGMLAIATSGHADTFMRTFDAATGSVVSVTPFSTQWPHYLAPTIYDGIVYNAAGYYGGSVLAVSGADGSTEWQSTIYGNDDMFTPAVDEDRVYHYDGTQLVVLDRTTGTLAFSIADPDPDTTGYSFHGAPILAGENDVISFSGGAFSGMALNSQATIDKRRLISFDLLAKDVNWKSAGTYLTQPAVADGLVFAGNTSPVRLEALDQADGSVQWTWTADEPSVTGYHRNVVVTDDLVFISSNIGVHAISRETQKEAWFAPTPGMLTITPNKVLIVTHGATGTNGTLYAYDLKFNGELSGELPRD